MKERLTRLQPCFQKQDPPTKRCIRAFQKSIYEFYETQGRDLPWRQTTDPYAILVSEIMLQQTQVDRVIEPYNRFLSKFPDPKSLARSPTEEVIKYWQGLGYNRRALNLKKAAVMMAEDGIPSDEQGLTRLPGIGPYTASAVTVFAFNKPAIVIETNIRSIFIFLTFPDREKVLDKEIQLYIDSTMDRENPRRWFNALMDAGASLKRQIGNPSRASASYQKQSPFEGSDRQIRGYILRELAKRGTVEEDTIATGIGKDTRKVRHIINRLEKEGFLSRFGRSVRLSD